MTKLTNLLFGLTLLGCASVVPSTQSLAANPASIVSVDSITSLQALGNASPQYGSVQVNGIRGGYFNWVTGSLPCNAITGGGDSGTTFCATSGGAYVTTGYWKRQLNGSPITPQMFKSTAVGSGNDLTAINAAITSASSATPPSKEVYFPAIYGTCYQTNGEIPVGAAIRLFGDGPNSCINNTVNTSHIIAVTSVNGIKIESLKLQYSTLSAPVVIRAGLYLNTVNHGLFNNLELGSMLNCGIYAQDSSSNLFNDIYTHDFQGSKTISCGDIYFRGATTTTDKNRITNSSIFGGANSNVGIGFQVQSGDTGRTLNNSVSNTEIGEHAGYGILAGYQGCTGCQSDVLTSIDHVYIHDINGDGNGALETGMCIYSASAGGISITNSTVSNCNVLTTGGTNNPAAVSLTFDSSQSNWQTLTPVVISNNQIITSHWQGITTNQTRAVITNNTVTNTATTANGFGIRVVDPGAGSVISNNQVKLGSSSQGSALRVITSTVAASGLVISGNSLLGSGSGNPYTLDVVGTSSFGIQGVVNNNYADGSASGALSARLSYFSGQFSGNKGIGQNTGLSLDNVSNVQGAANTFKGSNSANFLTSGTNSNSYFDSSNDFDARANPGKINNAVSGVRLSFIGSGAPASGTWQIGDTEYEITPTAGGKIGNVVTTAGTPGTWKGFGAIDP